MKKISLILFLFLVLFTACTTAIPKGQNIKGVVKSKELYKSNDEVILASAFSLMGDYQNHLEYIWYIRDEDGNLVDYEKLENGKKVKVPHKEGAYSVYFVATLRDRKIESEKKEFYVSQVEESSLKITMKVPEDTPLHNFVFVTYKELGKKEEYTEFKEQEPAIKIGENLWEVTLKNIETGTKLQILPTMGNWYVNRAKTEHGGFFDLKYLAYRDTEIYMEIPTWTNKVVADYEMYREPMVLINDGSENIDSISISWQDNKELEPIYFGKKGEELTKYTPIETKAGKVFKIDGLEKDTEYEYVINEKSYVFRSANPDNINFAVFSDTQNFPDLIKKGGELIKDYKPDFVLDTGDLMDNGYHSKDWELTFFEPLAGIFSEIPFIYTPGNHGMASPLQQEYFAKEHMWSSIKIGDMRFVIIDAYSTFSPGSEQYNFIEKELAKDDVKWKVLLSHESPYSDVPRHFSNLDMRKYLVPLIEKYKVDLYLSGHNHTYGRHTVNETKYITLTCMGAYTAEESPFAGKEIPLEKLIYDQNGFLLFDKEENKLTISLYNIENEMLDQITMEK